MPSEVLGVGSAVWDQIAFVSFDEQQHFAPHKGGTTSLSENEFQNLQNTLEITYSGPGGSAVNTLKGLVKLGRSCAILGKKGSDETGEAFENQIKSLGILSFLTQSPKTTTQVISLVTPDKDRTMVNFLGASTDFSKDHLMDNAFEGIRLCHLEGYLLFSPGALEMVMELAKARGAIISLNLASFQIANEFKETLAFLLERYVDILFCSEEEMEAFLGAPFHENQALIQALVPLALVTQGEKGAYVLTKSGLDHIPAEKVDVVDTTGAGDYFAAGFLDAHLKGQDPVASAKAGAKLAASICQVVGTN
ncbi:MAG: adenosine kinase [Chlamydiia bacterium]|nr:adenosine kinase [Chlamydiia bacterium]